MNSISGKEPRKSTSQPNTDTFQQTLSPSTRTSSRILEHDSTTSNETNQAVDIEFNIQDKGSGRVIAKECYAYQQNYYLLGLALQISPNLLGDEEDDFNGIPQATPEGSKSTCSVHNHTLTNADVVTLHIAQLRQAPLDRYLGEDLSERYAIVNIGSPNIEGQWSRYFKCFCGKSSISGRRSS